jgi:hypothetical protein
VFGVGITANVGSMVVAASSVVSGWIVPSGGLIGIAGVESGEAAPLVGGPPGTVLHEVVEGPPSGIAGEMFPVAVMTIGVGMVPNGAKGIPVGGDVIVVVVPVIDVVDELGAINGAGTGTGVIEGDGRGGTPSGCGAGIVEPGKSDMNDVAGCADSASGGGSEYVEDAEEAPGKADIVGAAETDGIVPIVVPIADIEVTGTAGVPGAINPVGVEQVTTVPGVVGSEASGTGASVVSGTAGWVAAENGLGPLSGDVTIAPGVDERPMAVVPMVETCARPALQPNSRTAVAKCRRHIAIPFSVTI